MKDHQEVIHSFSETLFGSIAKLFEETSELERKILATFAFGATYAQGILNGMSPPEVHELAISNLVCDFNYSPEQAHAFSEHLIQVSQSKDIHPTMHAIVHRGIDGHSQFIKGDLEGLKANLGEIVALVCG